jgi:HAD superfamily hydrolase (TIGR01509 family)
VARVRNIDWPEALLFDCDGVLVDTERDGHRITFNEAFQQKGLGQHVWDVDLYGELLETGGGKERMLRYFSDRVDQAPFASMASEEERWELCKELHALKTNLFMDLIASGRLPLRPGVKRLIEEAVAANVKVAVCSTSNEKAVQKIVDVMLGDSISKVMPVFAGDMVPKKKPDPAIYLMAARELNVDPARCVVVEDSRIGLLAGKAAGMRVVVTRSAYTQNEDFDIADAVFDCIGDAGDERFSLEDLTTPGSFWLNPPLPMDAHGNLYGLRSPSSPQSTGSGRSDGAPGPSADSPSSPVDTYSPRRRSRVDS